LKKDIRNSFLVKDPIAHRGFWNDELPENSLGAIKNAADNGFASEIDVQLLADGGVTVFHDDDLQRLTGKTGNISDLATRDLKNYNLQGTDFVIPTLDEVISVANGNPLLVEIKNNSTKNIGKLEEAVLGKMSGFKGEWAVQSFNPLVVKWFKDNAPEVLRGQISYDFNDENLNPIIKMLLGYMVLNPVTKPDFIGYDAGVLANRRLRRFAVERSTKNKPLLKWGIHSKQDFINAGKADNYIVDGFDISQISR